VPLSFRFFCPSVVGRSPSNKQAEAAAVSDSPQAGYKFLTYCFKNLTVACIRGNASTRNPNNFLVLASKRPISRI
jgi:hypothetical protein